MRLLEIGLENFRNVSGSRVAFSEPVTLFYGANAQGKTNLLEAIYMLGTTRSFRDNRIENLIQTGSATASVWGKVLRGGVEHELGLSLGPAGKKAVKNGAPATFSEVLRTMPVVALSAEDRNIVAGIPQHRRAFVDGCAVWGNPGYLDTLMSFGRVRAQRNAILRNYDRSRARELDAWTETFLKVADEVQGERAQATRAINEELQSLVGSLGMGETVRLAYEPDGGGDLGGKLEQVRGREIHRGSTLLGPHRDRVEILLDGRPIASHGSSGQGRAALWLLKLSRARIIARREGVPPLFLLDDVEAELDEERIGHMMSMSGSQTQMIMTATRPLAFTCASMARYKVVSGHCRRDM